MLESQLDLLRFERKMGNTQICEKATQTDDSCKKLSITKDQLGIANSKNETKIQVFEQKIEKNMSKTEENSENRKPTVFKNRCSNSTDFSNYSFISAINMKFDLPLKDTCPRKFSISNFL